MLPSNLGSLQQAADAINTSTSNSGVTASVVSDDRGQRLMLVSNSSGVGGNLTVSGSVTFTQGSVGEDASLLLDGVPISSASNTVVGAIPGVTINLAAAAPDVPVQLGIAANTSQAATTLNDFVTAYNSVMQAVNTQYATDASGNEGPLAGDSSLRVLQSQLLAAVTYSPGGTGRYINLQSLGVEMQNDGTLQVNTPKLNDALVNHYDDFQNFFQAVVPQGFGQYVGNVLLQATDPTQGAVGLDIRGLQSSSSDLTDQITAFEDRMAAVQQQLSYQYSNLNVLLEQYPTQIAEINSQLSALTPVSGKNA
jgi:flagellar hook-associated protein 2